MHAQTNMLKYTIIHKIVKQYQNYTQDVAKFSQYDFVNAAHISKNENYTCI